MAAVRCWPASLQRELASRPRLKLVVAQRSRSISTKQEAFVVLLGRWIKIASDEVVRLIHADEQQQPRGHCAPGQRVRLRDYAAAWPFGSCMEYTRE